MKMAKPRAKKIKTNDDQWQKLPEPIVHHIQSFLTTKEAVSTSILSKSWYSSWLTRPVLDFHEGNFPMVKPYPRLNSTFMDTVNNTMEKYNDLKLNIDSFKLCMNAKNIRSSSFATESIVKAMRMSVKNVNVKVNSRRKKKKYILPKEVFEAESMNTLSVSTCRIDGISGGDVKCSKLESLSLTDVYIGDDALKDIISVCPLLKNLYLFSCDGDLAKVDISNLVGLEKLGVTTQMDTKQTAYTHKIVSVTRFLSTVPEFHKLSYLVLNDVRIDSKLFDDFSIKFPCVEDLTVRRCSGCLRFDISSYSLKYVTLGHWLKLKVKLDVPNILKLKYIGGEVPDLIFTRASRKWMSDLYFPCVLEISWFTALKKVLTYMSGASIILNVTLPTGRLDARLLLISNNFKDLPKPHIVDYLKLEARYSTPVCASFLDVVFTCIQPKSVTQCFFPVLHKKSPKANKELPGIRQQKAKNKLLLLLYERLMDLKNGKDSKGSSSSGNVTCRNKIEFVVAFYFDDTLQKWQPQACGTLLDDIRSMKQKDVYISLQPKWAPWPPEGPGPNSDKPTTN